MGADFSSAQRLLEFLDGLLQNACGLQETRVRFGADGSLQIAHRDGAEERLLVWSEKPRGMPGEVVFRFGAIGPSSRVPWASEACLCGGQGRAADPSCARVAKALQQLGDQSPPDLFQWRNRNLSEVHWGSGLFDKLCPSIVRAGQTHYFDYLLAATNAYEGYLNLEFTSRAASVVVRVLPVEALGGQTPHAVWGPFALLVLEDGRSAAIAKLREHRVEDFVGYVLARNAPATIRLRYERDDVPAGWLPPDLHADFLRAGELDDTTLFHMMFSSSDDIALVTSCDRECLNLFSFVSSPVEEWSLAAPWQVRPSPTLLGRLHHAGLSEQALVMGEDLLGSRLDAIERAPNRPKLALYVDSCLNRLIGEDYRGALKDFGKRSRLPVVPYDIDLRQEPYLAGLTDFFERLYRAVPQVPGPAMANGVNLVGIAPDEELDTLLRSAGIEVVARLLPGLRCDELARFGQASLVVMNSWGFACTAVEKLLAAAGKPVVRLPLPYGLAGTADWVQGVARALGLPPKELEGCGEAEAELAEVKKRTEGHGIALFGRRDTMAAELAPERRFGIPLLRVLTELGLRIHLHVWSSDGQGGAEMLEEMGLDPGQGHSVRAYSHFRQIPELMTEGAFELVYTETFRDERITAAGKTPVTMRMFEPGLQGAVRTARRLACALQTTFFRDWARYLPEALRRVPKEAGS